MTVDNQVARPETWTVVRLLAWTTEYLSGKGVEDPRLNAELLLAGVLQLKRLDLYLQFDRPLQPSELTEIRSRLLRRARREPLQYIDGEALFRELRLRVDRRVLIPRPETELLVGAVLEWSRGRTQLRVLDVGTGSGAIALSLAFEGDFERVVASDSSDAALSLARENAEHNSLIVEFRQGDAFEPVEGERFDVIVSNPPYIAEPERESLEPEVRDWEPSVALFSGPTGFELLEALISGAPRHLRPGGLFAVEVGNSQAERVAGMIRATGSFAEPSIRNDLTGRERFVLAELE